MRTPYQKIVDFIVLPILTVCCVTVTALSVKSQFFRAGPSLPPRPTADAAGRVAADSIPVPIVGLTMGPKEAPLTLVEFADFQCPYCTVAAEQLRELKTKRPGSFKVVFKHLIIAGHVHARGAALAAECANEQGRFGEYYEKLFGDYQKLGKRSWSSFAKDAGISDLTRFENCVTSEKYAQNIVADSALAKKLGLGGTPTWVVGDSVYGGVPSMEQLERWIELGARAGKSVVLSSR